jgi:hypothetical protein
VIHRNAKSGSGIKPWKLEKIGGKKSHGMSAPKVPTHISWALIPWALFPKTFLLLHL